MCNSFANHPSVGPVFKKISNSNFSQLCNESVQKRCMDIGMEIDVKLNLDSYSFLLK